MRVLVATDDATSRRMFETGLRSLGHQCLTVIDGARAWAAFQSGRPDVVICDWMLPGISGLQFCRDVRADTSTSSYTYAIIIVTSQTDLDQIVEARSADVDDFLVKPFDTRDLQARLIGAAKVTSLRNQLARQRSELDGLNHERTAIAQRAPVTGLGNRSTLVGDPDPDKSPRVARPGHRRRTARARRAGAGGTAALSSPLELRGLVIDLDSHVVLSHGQPVALTNREFCLLAYLAASPGRLFSRDDLLRDVWQSSPEWQSAKTVTEHVRRLRQKLEVNPTRPTLIVTVGTAGYRLDPRSEPTGPPMP